MKTKYILHGGSAQTRNSQNDKFFSEILKGTPKTVNVLLVHFASDPEKAVDNKTKDTAQFQRIKKDKTLNFDVARDDMFLEQMEKADIIYFGGGTTVRLLAKLKQFSNLKKYFAGKIVAGESAGANFLASYCYSKSAGGVLQGLGIVQIKLICHYEGKYKEELEAIPEKLEIVTLTDYQFRIF